METVAGSGTWLGGGGVGVLAESTPRMSNAQAPVRLAALTSQNLPFEQLNALVKVGLLEERKPSLKFGPFAKLSYCITETV